MHRALLADDDPTFVLLLEHVFDGLGLEYDTATDGLEAWNLWEAKRHDLVVLDIVMPGMDGLEVCRRIRSAEPDRATFVLVVTGRDKAADLEAGLEAGADDYVTKPTNGQRLLARTRIALRRMQEAATRRAAEEELRQARFMAGIGQATIGLQHEINNPLTGLLGTAELMLLDFQEKGLPTDDIRVIIEQGRRISALVKKLGEMRDPQSVRYAAGKQMLDLGDEK